MYTLRSVTKDPSRLVPAWAPYLGLANVVTDGISAGHPYGAAAAAALAEAAGVAHMHPRLAFVPHQPRLDSFDADFGGRLYWLEYEPEGEIADWLGGAGRFTGWVECDDLHAAWRRDSAPRCGPTSAPSCGHACSTCGWAIGIDTRASGGGRGSATTRPG